MFEIIQMLDPAPPTGLSCCLFKFRQFDVPVMKGRPSLNYSTYDLSLPGQQIMDISLHVMFSLSCLYIYDDV